MKGYLSCFSQHNDKKFELNNFYNQDNFVKKVQQFVACIITIKNYKEIQEQIPAKGGIQELTYTKNPKEFKILNIEDRLLPNAKVYKLDFGNVAFRLYFALSDDERRCYILALDTNHEVQPYRKQRK